MPLLPVDKDRACLSNNIDVHMPIQEQCLAQKISVKFWKKNREIKANYLHIFIINLLCLKYLFLCLCFPCALFQIRCLIA